MGTVRASCFNQQIEALQQKFQICLTPLQIAKIGRHFLGNLDPSVLTLEFTEEQWHQRVAAHPIESWAAEGNREFEVFLVGEALIARIKGALGTKDELPHHASATLGEYQLRRSKASH